jgi:hypothetical protein
VFAKKPLAAVILQSLDLIPNTAGLAGRMLSRVDNRFERSNGDPALEDGRRKDNDQRAAAAAPSRARSRARAA